MRKLRELVCEGTQAFRKRLRACVTGPRKGASQAPERLSALRSLALCEGKTANLGGLMTREKDDACPLYTAVIPGRERSEEPGIHIIGCGVWIPGSPLLRRPGMTT